MHFRKDIESHFDARCRCFGYQARGVVEQRFVAAHLHVDRWQAAQICVQRSRQWLARVLAVEVHVGHHLQPVGANNEVIGRL